MAFAVEAAPGGEVSVPLWRALRTAAAPATVNELHRASRAHPQAIQLRLKCWSRVGFVSVIAPQPILYGIAPDWAGRVEAPGPGLLSADAWRAMRKLGRFATFGEILAASGASDRPLYCRLRRWSRSGYVVKVEALPSRYVMSPDAPDVATPPRVPINAVTAPPPGRRTARARIWTTMRILKSFDIPMLMMTAEASRRACEDFINLLARAGYVRNRGYAVRARPRGEGQPARNLAFARDWSTYQLVRSTGPTAPVITNPPDGERRLVDRNTGQSVPIGPGLNRRAREVNHVR